jgi:hypothetical protein
MENSNLMAHLYVKNWRKWMNINFIVERGDPTRIAGVSTNKAQLNRVSRKFKNFVNSTQKAIKAATRR